MTAAQIDQRHGGRDACAERREPDPGAGTQQDAVGAIEVAGVQARPRPRAGRGVGVVGHQQAVCAELLVLDDNTVPSLVVIEQLSLLTRNRLDACTEPTSDCEMGVTVRDHGM